ncbi:MAG: hypothetical protein PHW56_05915 [Methanosarcinaceae archaeon]|nr:hypothetical protein [Methanosarcinaceae archaeon]
MWIKIISIAASEAISITASEAISITASEAISITASEAISIAANPSQQGLPGASDTRGKIFRSSKRSYLIVCRNKTSSGWEKVFFLNTPPFCQSTIH